LNLPGEEAGTTDARDGNWGDWLSTQVTFSTPVRHLGMLTVGGEASDEIRNLQTVSTTTPVLQEILKISDPNRGVALFAQQEIPISPKLKIYAGLRQDYSHNFHLFAAPRVALVFNQSAVMTYKASYARAFRNPSTFEKYYQDELSDVRNLSLHQEQSHVFEGSVERGMGKRMTAVISGFHYHMHDIIQAEATDDGRSQYRNSGQLRLTGVETELSGSPLSWLEASASAVYQRGRDATTSRGLVNSPAMLGKARLGLPIAKRRATVSCALRGWSSRATGTGVILPPVALLDAGISTAGSRSGFEFAAGVRNLSAHNYEDPVDLSWDRIRANGRTWYVRLSWRSKE
jgi:outer membrane receptor for ferrienterochelin and colicin